MIQLRSVTPKLKRIEFRDFLRQQCVLTQSLNLDKPKVHFGVTLTEDGEHSSQMVLTPELVRELLPFLVKFALENRLFESIEELKSKLTL